MKIVDFNFSNGVWLSCIRTTFNLIRIHFTIIIHWLSSLDHSLCGQKSLECAGYDMPDVYDMKSIWQNDYEFTVYSNIWQTANRVRCNRYAIIIISYTRKMYFSCSSCSDSRRCCRELSTRYNYDFDSFLYIIRFFFFFPKRYP